MDWVRLLPFVTGMVDQELLAGTDFFPPQSTSQNPRDTGSR
jgi:hypothetical protein